MRSSKSRSRSKSNRSRSVGNVVNRVFDSSGPEGKVRGTPQQIIDKYNQLARDAQLSNDRVAMENFQQHAEHYMRMLGEALREQEARREAQEAQARERQQHHQQPAAPRDEPRTPAEKAAPGETPAGMPDVIDVAPEADNGLVDTPEAGPAPKPRGRRRGPRTPKPEAETASDNAPAGDSPEAAE